MAYVDPNFPTKKALKEALANGERVEVFQPVPVFGALKDGTVYLEGPHFPEPHKWYAEGIVKDGVLIKIR
jgi:hypothetical protein